MKLLILEDNEKHLNDVKNIVNTLKEIKADFVTNLIEALTLLNINRYDVVISDVFFPKKKEDNAESFENAIEIHKYLSQNKIYHIFCTSGHHHGNKYKNFNGKTEIVSSNSQSPFGNVGIVLEVKQTGITTEGIDPNGESDTKPWTAAIAASCLTHEFYKLFSEEQGVVTDCEISKNNKIHGQDNGSSEQTIRNYLKKIPFVAETLDKYGLVL